MRTAPSIACVSANGANSPSMRRIWMAMAAVHGPRSVTPAQAIIRPNLIRTPWSVYTATICPTVWLGPGGGTKPAMTHIPTSRTTKLATPQYAINRWFAALARPAAYELTISFSVIGPTLVSCRKFVVPQRSFGCPSGRFPTAGRLRRCGPATIAELGAQAGDEQVQSVPKRGIGDVVGVVLDARVQQRELVGGQLADPVLEWLAVECGGLDGGEPLRIAGDDSHCFEGGGEFEARFGEHTDHLLADAEQRGVRGCVRPQDSADVGMTHDDVVNRQRL